MRYDELIDQVRDRGEIPTAAAAEATLRTVLATLGEKVSPGAARSLLAELPAPVKDQVGADAGSTGAGETAGEGLIGVLARRMSVTPEVARRRAAAVFAAIAASGVAGGALRDFRAELPGEVAELVPAGESGGQRRHRDDVLDLRGDEREVLRAVSILETDGEPAYATRVADKAGMSVGQARQVLDRLRERDLVTTLTGADEAGDDLGPRYVQQG